MDHPRALTAPDGLFWLSMQINGRLRRLATAFAIGPDRLMTAAHAVLDSHTGDWFARVRVQRVDPGTLAVDWSCEVSPRGFSVPPSYRQNDDAPNDYAVIRLPTPAPAGRSFRLWAAPDAALQAAVVTAAGFPKGGQRTCRTGPVEVSPGVLRHTLLGGVGTSGAPLWIDAGGERLVVGIHSRAAGRNGRAAARITPAVIGFVQDAGGSNGG